jgi:hypothetical protein
LLSVGLVFAVAIFAGFCYLYLVNLFKTTHDTVMELPPTWSEVCICGRTFSVPQAYTFHKRSCQKTKKRLANALHRAKEEWEARKRRKTGETEAEQQALDGSSDSHMAVLPEPVSNVLDDPTCVSPEVRLSFRHYLLLPKGNDYPLDH